MQRGDDQYRRDKHQGGQCTGRSQLPEFSVVIDEGRHDAMRQLDEQRVFELSPQRRKGEDIGGPMVDSLLRSKELWPTALIQLNSLLLAMKEGQHQG